MQSAMNPQLDAINMFLPLALAGICDMYANPYEDNRQYMLSEITDHIENQKEMNTEDRVKALVRGIPPPPEISFFQAVHWGIMPKTIGYRVIKDARRCLLSRRYSHEIEEWEDPEIRWLSALKWELLPGTTRYRRLDDQDDSDDSDDSGLEPDSFYYTEDIAPYGTPDEPLHMIDYSRRSCFKFVYNKLVASEIRYLGRKR